MTTNMEDSEWEGRINVIKKALRQNDAKMQEVMSSVEKINVSMGEQMTAIKKQAEYEWKQWKQWKETMKNQVGLIQNQVSSMEKDIKQDIKEILTQMKTLSSSQSANASN